MGPYQRTPDQVSCDRAIRYSGFFGVRSVGPVGQISWNVCLFQVIVFFSPLFTIVNSLCFSCTTFLGSMVCPLFCQLVPTVSNFLPIYLGSLEDYRDKLGYRTAAWLPTEKFIQDIAIFLSQVWGSFRQTKTYLANG